MLSFMRLLLIVALAVITAGCSAVAGIFKAGFWVGMIVAIVVVLGVFALMKKR